VETEGPKIEEGASKAGTQGNVVPFPRDWLGPRDELVPFGEGASSQTGELGDTSPSGTPGPDAFWEGSAEIQAVLQGPDTTSVEEPERVTPVRAARPHRPRALGARLAHSREIPRSRTVFSAAVALLGVAILAVATTVMSGSSGGSKARSPGVGEGSSASATQLADLQKSRIARSRRAAAGQTQLQSSRRPRGSPIHRASPSHGSHHKAAPANRGETSASRRRPSAAATGSRPSSDAAAVISNQTAVRYIPVAASSPSPLAAGSSPPVDASSPSSGVGDVSGGTETSSSSPASGGHATSSASSPAPSKSSASAGPTGNSALLGPGHCSC
jgi:hypothetical protein